MKCCTINSQQGEQCLDIQMKFACNETAFYHQPTLEQTHNYCAHGKPQN